MHLFADFFPLQPGVFFQQPDDGQVGLIKHSVKFLSWRNENAIYFFTALSEQPRYFGTIKPDYFGGAQ
jgi:hypothetical protein